jgi:hypothetical protein
MVVAGCSAYLINDQVWRIVAGLCLRGAGHLRS